MNCIYSFIFVRCHNENTANSHNENTANSHNEDGKWGAVEMKLGDHDIDKAAKNLRKLSNKVDAERMNSPSFLAVVTGTEFAYTRDDGVHVVPIGCLRD